MSTFLQGYGAGDEKRERRVKRTVVIVVGGLLLTIFGWFGFRNFSARNTFDNFIDLLKTKDYKSAYALWGCTDQTPCRDYSYERFLRDWGPDSPAKNASSARKVRGATCGGIITNTGVLRIYHFDPDNDVSLWVDKQDGKLGFAPVIGKLQCTILP